MSDTENPLGFAPPEDVPIEYMRRTRDYYLALGFDNPYRWAHYREVPFQPLAKPLAEARLALITTAAPYQPGKGDQGPGAPYNAAAKFYRVYSQPSDQLADLRISHVGIDRAHTTAEDINSYFPMAALQAAAKAGRVGEVAPRFHGVPTDRSQAKTLQRDCPEVLERLQADKADAALLIAN